MKTLKRQLQNGAQTFCDFCFDLSVFDNFSLTVLLSPESSLVVTLVFLAMNSSEKILAPQQREKRLRAQRTAGSAPKSRNYYCPGRRTIFLPRFGSGADRFRVAGRLTTFQFIRKLTVFSGNYKSTKNIELP